MYIFMLWHLWFMFTFGGFIFLVYRLSCPSRPLPATLSQLPPLPVRETKNEFSKFPSSFKNGSFYFCFYTCRCCCCYCYCCCSVETWFICLFFFFFTWLVVFMTTRSSFFGRRFRHRNMQSVWQNRNGVIATQSCSLYLQMIIIRRSFGVHYFWFMCYRF